MEEGVGRGRRESKGGTIESFPKEVLFWSWEEDEGLGVEQAEMAGF